MGKKGAARKTAIVGRIAGGELPPPIEFTRAFVCKFLSGAHASYTNEGIGYASLAQRYPHLSKQRVDNIEAGLPLSQELIARYLGGSSPKGPVDTAIFLLIAEHYPNLVKQRSAIVASYDRGEALLNARLKLSKKFSRRQTTSAG